MDDDNNNVINFSERLNERRHHSKWREWQAERNQSLADAAELHKQLADWHTEQFYRCNDDGDPAEHLRAYHLDMANRLENEAERIHDEDASNGRWRIVYRRAPFAVPPIPPVL